MPKVTVLMAVYNDDHYLCQAIDSILRQTFQDFEFLIINDGSTDTSLEIIQSYRDPRIRLINNGQNLGLTRSLNKGLRMARGELIARQDADDISEPERLEKQVALFKADPEVRLVGTWASRINELGNFIGINQPCCTCVQIRWELLFHNTFIHSSVMLKSDVLESVGFYDENFHYAQDFDYWCRIARKMKIENIGEPLVQSRVHSSSMTEKNPELAHREPRQTQIKYLEELLNPEELKAWKDGTLLKIGRSLIEGFHDEFIELDTQNLRLAFQETDKIHKAFCRYYMLDNDETKKHESIIKKIGSDNLIDFSNYYLDKSRRLAWFLWIRAYSLNGSVIFQAKYLILALKLLVGFRATSLIKSIQA